MKSDFLKKIIAATVITTSMGTLVPSSVLAVDFYAWQNGISQSNGYWQQKGDQWYFYDYSGTMKTGWIDDKGARYYLDSNGVMQTGVVQVEGKIYLFSNSGAMQTGNAVIDGKYYTFNESGAAVGSNVPTPAKAFGKSGEPTVPYTPEQVVRNEDSSPGTPNTVARDPQNLVKYTLRFRDDDGDDLRTNSIEKGEEVSLYKPTKKGYEFVEWNTKENGNGTSYDAGEKLTVDRNISLYAQWKEASSNSGNSGNNDNSNPGNKVLAEEIEISSSSSTITTKGGTLQMTANVLPIDASDKNVIWSVENGTGKATISSSGLLTASDNGSVIVVATSAGNSSVIGKYNISISGQVDSGTTPGTGGNTGGNTPGTGDNTGGNTTTGGKIIGIDPNTRIADVVISGPGDAVDLPLLKTSGKLPTTAKVTCTLSDGTTKQIEMPIKDWSEASSKPFDGTKADEYELTATLGLPTGYTSSVSPLPTAKLKVIITSSGIQTDNRIKISNPTQIPGKILDTNQHIVNIGQVNSILPSKVVLTDDNGKTVEVNVKSWSVDGGSQFDGKVVKSWNMIAAVDVPAGYRLLSTAQVSTTLDVKVPQTAGVQSLKEVVSAATSGFTLDYAINDKLDLNKLRIIANYADGTSKELLYSEFADNGITTPGYYNGYPLTTSIKIPIALNGDIELYTESLNVGVAVAPSVTTSTAVVFNMDSGISNDAVFSYTLGTGSKKVNGVKSVSLGNTVLDNTKYYETASSKTITIKKEAIQDFYNNGTKNTPSSCYVNVVFNSAVDPTKEVKAASNPLIHFISTPATPSISLAPREQVAIPKDYTMRLTGLEANVKYEYCVVTTSASVTVNPNWTNAESFDSITTYKDLTDTDFVAGNWIYIRKKSTSDGFGATNPESGEQKLEISATNISRTLSSAKSITSFSITGTDNKDYTGTIVEGGLSGTITAVVPTIIVTDAGTGTYTNTEMDVSNLKANIKASPLTTVNSVSPGTDGSFVITSNFLNSANQVTYTVKAENGTTKDYTATLYKTLLQGKSVRSDLITYSDIDSNGVTTTASVQISKAYTDAGITIGGTETPGFVKIGFKNIPFTDENKTALEVIRKATPDANYQIANVEMIPTKPTMPSTVVSVKVANSLDELKLATAISLSSTTSPNVKNGQYYEKIPVAINEDSWTKVSAKSITKYYQWIDAKGNSQYTSLLIYIQ
ncbi:InlB B-repeat-containing protein [Clostridium sp. C2-6-12]|uniref:InlB B-repeat-containing protein n=1 Tax=Clostridium sp. C2-6-12 TaxID=2698832 RepID=UPI00136F9CCE|nr:InlB B-repeat-containing protein [Clostridium sp. C2-6-12]